MGGIQAGNGEVLINGKKVLAIIPARGGSKILPRKNILTIAGKPLIAWSIEAANQSKYIDKTIISTDDSEIASIAKKYHGEVPFIRPQSLATDEATTSDVIIHAIDSISGDFDIILLLQPTSPLRDSGVIDDALEFMEISSSSAIISVTKRKHPRDWTIQLDDNCKVINYKDMITLKRRQEYKELFDINGAIYASLINNFFDSKTFFGNNTIAFKMLEEKSIDIDDSFDFEIAEYFLNKQLIYK
jgi:CMP-N-acetylneuraminic acid synthetase